MLTPSVNVVQSSFPEELQGEISGLSRAISNLRGLSAVAGGRNRSSPALAELLGGRAALRCGAERQAEARSYVTRNEPFRATVASER
jgi:hypothetical protein